MGELKFLKVGEFAKIKGINEKTVWNWIYRGKVKAVKIGGVVRIPVVRWRCCAPQGNCYSPEKVAYRLLEGYMREKGIPVFVWQRCRERQKEEEWTQ